MESKKILIVVDMINDFVTDGGALYFPEGKAIIPAIKKKLDEYKANSKPVIFLKDSHCGDEKEFNRFPPHAIIGTNGGLIANGLEHDGGIIVSKTRFDGFYGTNLEEVLRYLNIKTVEIVGVCTSICIMETAGSCVDRDYKVEVPADCVADLTPENHLMGLERMITIYGIKIT